MAPANNSLNDQPMPSLRRYLPPLLLLLPLIFICGKLLLTMVPSTTQSIPTPQERGWPWVFQINHDHSRALAVPDDFFSIFILLADLVFLLAVIGTLALLLAWRRKRTGRLFRFSLRELLVLIAAAAIPCAWWASHLRQQRVELAIESRWEGTLWLQPASYSAPGWLRRLTDHPWTELFERAELAYIIVKPHHRTETAEFPPGLAADLAPLADLRRLVIADGRSDPDDPAPCLLRLSEADLRALERIELIMIEGPVDDETLRSVAKLPHLEDLWIDKALITSAGIDALLKFPELRKLTIKVCESPTDEQIMRLIELPCLQSLQLDVPDSISRDLSRRIRKKKPHLELLGFPLESNSQEPSEP
jgi:hypothetical protein